MIDRFVQVNSSFVAGIFAGIGMAASHLNGCVAFGWFVVSALIYVSVNTFYDLKDTP